MIDKKGEKSIDMAIGALSVSSELNDKNNTPIIAKGQFDVLSMDANLGIRDEGFEVGANMNIVSASGNIGLSIGTKEMEVRLSIGGSVGINTGFEVLFDFSKGIVLDIALIFGGRIEVNWEKTDGQEN